MNWYKKDDLYYRWLKDIHIHLWVGISGFYICFHYVGRYGFFLIDEGFEKCCVRVDESEVPEDFRNIFSDPFLEIDLKREIDRTYD
jgi:hypothetical protein